MPKYEPDPWNDPTVVHLNACYNYALDRRDQIERHPGDLAGLPKLTNQDAGSATELTTRAIGDGLTRASGPTATLAPDQWLVALVVRAGPPGTYHWYRRDDDGGWSHKPRHHPATNRDDSGCLIADPQLCDRIWFPDFVGYFIVDPRSLPW